MLAIVDLASTLGVSGSNVHFGTHRASILQFIFTLRQHIETECALPARDDLEGFAIQQECIIFYAKALLKRLLLWMATVNST